MSYQQFADTQYKNWAITDRCRFPDELTEYNNKSIVQYGNTYPHTPFCDLKYEARNEIQPSRQKSTSCILMLFANLADSHWISIDCHKPLLAGVMCAFSKQKVITNSSNEKSMLRNKSCVPSLLFCKLHCFLFHWYSPKRENNPKSCSGTAMEALSLPDVDILSTILDAVPSKFPAFIFLDESKSKLQIHKHNRYLSGSQIQVRNASLNEAEGLKVCFSEPITVSNRGTHLFSCENNRFISYLLVCDRNVDCPIHKADETNCNCTQTNKTSQEHKAPGGTEDVDCVSLFYKSVKGSFETYIAEQNDMAESNLSTSRNFVLCNNGKQLSVAFLDDLYPDCGPDAEDELILRKLLENNTISLCRLPSELHCRQGHSVCYNVTDICVYKLNSLSNLIPCRSGKHLMNCFGFECNAMFKCPSAYCIPWSCL